MSAAKLHNIYRYFLSNFHIKNVLNLSSLAKVALIYGSGIFWPIILTFDYSSGIWEAFKNRKMPQNVVSIYSVQGRIGEKTLYNRILRVLDKQGFNYIGVCFPEFLTHFWLTRHFYNVALNLVNYTLHPRFNLAVTHHVNIVPHGYNITYLNMPTTSFYDVDGKFLPKWLHLTRYDAYVDLYSFIHGNNSALAEAMKAHNLKNKQIIPAYFAHNYIAYEPANIDSALVTGSIWGCGRGSLRFVRTLKKLGEDNLMVFYGLKYMDFLGDAYKGTFESLGNVEDNITIIHRQYGIALIAHNLEHMAEGLPTSRISEAVASGALVISDNNYFVHKYFGDNALYFDILSSPEHMYEQIKKHIIWARNNKAEAQAKAKAAYEIFAQHLTIDRQFQSLIQKLEFMQPDSASEQ